MFDFNNAVEVALRTWYPKDHPLHFNPHHPLGKLLGEWGELLDDYMKSIYKPGYTFEPLDELGDIWYYVRILCYQEDHIPKDAVDFFEESVDQIMVQCMVGLGEIFCDCSMDSFSGILNETFSAIVQIGERYDITLQQLTDSNWEKLKPGSERGDEWMRARMETVKVGKY